MGLFGSLFRVLVSKGKPVNMKRHPEGTTMNKIAIIISFILDCAKIGERAL